MVDGPISEGSDSKLPAGCLIAFGSLFGLVGLVFLWVSVLAPLSLHLAAKSWAKTPCTIKTAEIAEDQGEDGSTYLADFTYSYQVDGVPYVGDRDGVARVYGKRSLAKRRLKELPVGKQVDCWYDPRDPSQSLLDPTLGQQSLLLLSLVPLVFTLAGGVTAYFGLRQRRANRTRSAPAEPVSHTMFRPGVIDRDLHEQEKPAKFQPDAVLRGNQSPDAVASDEQKDLEADVPQRLKAGSSAWVRLLGLLFIATFWNGLVGFFVNTVLFDPPMGGGWGQWGLALFLVPFALIGLLMIAAAIHAAIGLFSPSVSVALSTGAVDRGGELDVAWEVRGGWRKIGTLNVVLIGTEWARYQQGTDTRTDESIFEVVPVVTTYQQSEISFGNRTVTVPVSTMHTFGNDNNKIKWAVRVNGVIRWWPDVNEEFSFRVKPQVAAGVAKQFTAEAADA